MLKAFIQFLVYSNIWISLGATFFTFLFYLVSGYPPNYYLLLFIFSSTLATYTFQRLVKLKSGKKISGPRMDWMIKNSTLSKVLLIATIFIAFITSFTLTFQSFFILAGLALISFFYAIEIKFSANKKSNLRDIPSIKIFLIGIVWGLSSCLLPYFQFKEWSNSFIWPITISFVLYILALCIPFDIRDLNVDEERKKTIPQIVGVGGSKIVGILMLITSFFILAFSLEFYSIGLLIGYFITILVISFSNKKKDELFFSFVIDGQLILMPFLVYLDQIV